MAPAMRVGMWVVVGGLSVGLGLGGCARGVGGGGRNSGKQADGGSTCDPRPCTCAGGSGSGTLSCPAGEAAQRCICGNAGDPTPDAGQPSTPARSQPPAPGSFGADAGSPSDQNEGGVPGAGADAGSADGCPAPFECQLDPLASALGACTMPGEFAPPSCTTDAECVTAGLPDATCLAIEGLGGCMQMCP